MAINEWIDLDKIAETSPADIIRINNLEDHYEIYQYFNSISGASGTVTIPTGYTVDLNRFGNGIDAIITTLGTDSRPLDQVVYTNAGALVTTSLNSSGDYVLSGTPSSYPVAITYYLKGKTKYKDNLVYDNILGVDMLISSSYSGTSTTNVVNEYALSTGLATKQNTLTNPVTGTGTSGTIPLWNGATTLTNSGLTSDGTDVIAGTIANGRNLTVRGTQGSEMLPALTGNSGDANGWTLSSTTGYVQPFNGSIDKTGNGTGALTSTNNNTAPSIGSNYIITIVVATMSGTSAAITVTFGGNTLTTITVAGTYTYNILATSTAKLILTGTPTATRYSITGISQKVYSLGNLLTKGTLTVGNAVGIGVESDPANYTLKVNGNSYSKGNIDITGTFSGYSSSLMFAQNILRTGTTASPVSGLSIQATSLATSGVTERRSPNIQMLSTAWDGASSQANGISIGVRSIPGATTYGALIFENSYVNSVINTNELMRLTTGGLLGIGTTSPTNILSLGGQSAQTIWIERNITSNTAGNSLTIQSGGATIGATDKMGGNLILSSGISTGTEGSYITFLTSPVSTTGTSDNTPVEVIRLTYTGLGIGTTVPVSKLHILTSGVQFTSSGSDTPLDALIEAPDRVLSSNTGHLAVWSDSTLAASIGGSIAFGGRYTSTQSATWAIIKGIKTDAVSGNCDGHLIFATRDSGGNCTEKMRITSTGSTVFAGKVLEKQGASIASASTIVLGIGNTFELTGTTAINLITSTDWQNGSKVTLISNESVTINHGTATSGSDITILLAGAGNFAMTANDTLTLVLSSTTAGGAAWREIARTAI